MNCEYANDQEAEPDVTMNDFFFRIGALIALAIFAVLLLVNTGCSTFKFATLATVEIHDSANGNTVPVSAVP